MDRLIFIPLFLFFSLLFVLLSTIEEEKVILSENLINKLSTNVLIIFKVIPTLLVTLFVFLNPLDDSLVSIIFPLAFFLCFLADIGLEKNFLVGMILFLLAQLSLIVSFLTLAFTFDVVIENVVIALILFLLVLVYDFFLLRYLSSSEKGLGEFKVPVLVYSVVISIMFVSTIYLFLSSSVIDSLLISFGALFFVISDSFIAFREFHHKFKWSELIVMSTYYGALLFLSGTVLIF
ncbi:MAG: lysoplasmalogenase [Candidatus Hodarchaeales archaeon]|jgi:uncharacterized membrane protein YhhN